MPALDQYPTDVVLLAVLWRLRYKLGFRDVAELLLQRGYVMTHETVRVWEFWFAPLVAQQLRARRRGSDRQLSARFASPSPDGRVARVQVPW